MPSSPVISPNLESGMPLHEDERSLPDASYLVVAARADEKDPHSGASLGNRDHTSLDDSDSPLREYDLEKWAPSPQSVGFWHRSMDKVRAHTLELWTRTVLILVVFMLAALALYWAVLFHIEDNMGVLTVKVVDLDGKVAPYDNVQPLIGPIVTRLAQQTVSETRRRSLGYKVVSPDDFGYDPVKVRRDVYDFHCYAAIIVNSNATALLEEAIDSGNSTYDPTGAIQMVMVSARDEWIYHNYIMPQLEKFTRALMSEFGPTWAQQLATNNSITKEMLAAAPSAVNPGISPLQIDLRPSHPPTATPPVTVGLIYLIMMAFFSFSFFFPIHQKYLTPKGHPPLHFWQFIIWRWLATVLSYFFVSLAYSLVSMAFQVSFSDPAASPVEVALRATAYGRGSFVVYWMVNFVGMTALGLACENVAMLAGQPWTALWLIFWVITNVTSAFYAVDLAPGFFRWGYAWPLHHVVEATRTIMFNLHSRIGLNFGVLAAWVAVDTVLFPLCCQFQRWKTESVRTTAQRERNRYVVHSTAASKETRTTPPKR